MEKESSLRWDYKINKYKRKNANKEKRIQKEERDGKGKLYRKKERDEEDVHNKRRAEGEIIRNT